MAETVKIHGLEGVRRALRKLPKEVAKRELDKALRAGGKPILQAAKSYAPVGEESFIRTLRGKDWAHTRGTLLSSIVMRGEKKKFRTDAAKQRIGVAVKRNDLNGAWYWRFVEFGTIKMPAQPFLTPAFESMRFAADAIIRDRLLKGVQRQARKVRGK